METVRLTPTLEDQCASCSLHKAPGAHRQVTTEYSGDRVDVMFIAEAPGAKENETGRPTIGPTGQILRRTIQQLNGGTLDRIAFGNMVRCRPTQSGNVTKDRSPTPAETRCCAPNLWRDIETLRPRYIVFCGSAAARMAHYPDGGDRVDPKTKITKLRGQSYEVRLRDGTIIPATVTFHFSYVSRSPSQAGVFREDVARAMRRATGKLRDYSKRGKPAVIVRDADQALDLLKNLSTRVSKQNIVALDYETTDIYRRSGQMLCVGLTHRPDQGYVIPYQHREATWTPTEFKQIRAWLHHFLAMREPSYRSLVAHNLKFEIIQSRNHFKAHMRMPMEDTRSRAHALNEDRKGSIDFPYGLKRLGEEQLGFLHYGDSDIAPIVALRNRGALAEAPLQGLAEYNAMDCYVTHRLFFFQEQWAEAEGYRELLERLGLYLHGPICRALAEMEWNGIRADIGMIRRLASTRNSPILQRQAEILRELYQCDSVVEANRRLLASKKIGGGLWGNAREQLWDFDIGKPLAKRLLYFDVMGLKPVSKSKKTGAASVDKEFLKRYADVKEVEMFAEWSALDKLRGTYVKSIYKFLHEDPDMREDHRVRPNYNPTGTITGRISSSAPNMLNIPSRSKTASSKAIKRMYIVDEGHVMVCADYSQAEVRWLAEVTGDPDLIRAFNEAYQARENFKQNPSEENLAILARVGDFHRHTASMINEVDLDEVTKEMRQAAKCVHPDTLVFAAAIPRRFHTLADFSKPGVKIACDGSTLVYAKDDQYASVTAAINDGIKPMLHILSRRGILTCSHEHRFQLADGTLRRAGDLKQDDVLADIDVPCMDWGGFSPVPVHVGYGLPTCEYTPTEATAYFAGLYLGDGVKMASHSVAIAHGSVDKIDPTGTSYADWQEILAHAADEVGIDTQQRRNKLLYLGGRHVMRWMRDLELITDECGGEMKHESRGSKVPSWILSAGRDAMMHFLAGLFDTDGTVSKGALSFTTKHISLAADALTVLHSMGFHPALDPSWNATYERYYYRVRLPVGEGGHFRDVMRHPGKVAQLHAPSKVRRLSPNKVLQILDAGEGPCYDVMIDSEDHLYCTNGFTTHNTIMFGLVYGMTVFGLASRLGLDKRGAQKFIDKFFARFPKAKEWLDGQEQIGFEQGCVISPTGRRKLTCANIVTGTIDENELQQSFADHRNFVGHELRVSRNAPIQGVASDTTMLAIVAILDYILDNGLSWRIINTVYDSIMVEVPWRDAAQCCRVMQEIMESPRLFEKFGLRPRVPFASDVSLGPNWGDQWDVVDHELEYTVTCTNSCGAVRSEKAYPQNIRCEECGSYDVAVTMVKGPLHSLVNQIETMYTT